MQLHHLHLPALIPYSHASHLQSLLVRQHLSFLAASPQRNSTFSTPSISHLPSRPPPYLLTFTPPPTYTCGRREISHLSPEQIAHLRANGFAEFHEATRGGQTTFHGPGQLVAYLICHLSRHGLDTRTHIRLLEDSVIGTLARYGIEGFRTESPGVWVRAKEKEERLNRVPDGEDAGGEGEERKIASVGVHLRRYVSSYGIALNVDTDLRWFERIVACGMPGKKTTSMQREGAGGIWHAYLRGVPVVFEDVMAKLLPGVEEAKRIEERDVLSLEETSEEEERRREYGVRN